MSDGERESPSAVQRGEHVATLIVLAAVGVMLAVVEAFLVPLRLSGGVEGLAVVLGFAGNVAVGSFAGISLRSSWAAATPFVAWFVAIAMVVAYAPGGDVVLPGQLKSDPGVVVVATLFMVCGLLGGAAGVVVTTIAAARSDRATARATPSG